MASDELIWQILDKQFCSYKTDALNNQNFCKHPMNVTGFCKMAHCPLANSQYATVVEKEGKMYLCIKTPERAHLPRKLWEKIPLPYNLDAAFAQIDKSLRFWDSRKIRRCKLRYHRLFLMLRRMRKLKQRVTAKMVPVKKKVERRLKSREQKAEKIAMLEHKIEAELLERLRKGVYPKELYQTEADTTLDDEKKKQKKKQSGGQKEKDEQAERESIDDVVFEEDESDLDELEDEFDEEEEEFEDEEEFEMEEDDDVAEFDFSDAEEDIEDIYNELEEEYAEQKQQMKKKSSGSGGSSGKMKSADSKKRLRSNDDDDDDEDDDDSSNKKKKSTSNGKKSGQGSSSSSAPGAKRPRRRRHLEIEYEDSADRETLSA